MGILLGAALAVLIVAIAFRSLRLIIGLIFNIIGGTIVLWLFNLIAVNFNLTIEINLLTSFLVGFFGLPAVVLMILIKLFV
ncbi:MAG: pro-sigmaK processing inhibitor BofA family protein [Peptoniphilus sp.]|nr:pro-sigmaK processing inhibitor BofA family protein [Peptoniphilus sp.]